MEAFLQALPYIFGTTSVASIILFFVFYKQNKALKSNEVKKSDTEVESGNIQNDMAQIDLGNHYLQSIVEASKLINEANKNIADYSKERQDNFEKLDSDLNEIKEDVKSIKKEQTLITLYLNGGYEKFKEHIKEVTTND